MRILRALAPAALAATLGTLAACGTLGPQVGPPDLDTTSPAAPHCEPQVYPPRALMRGDRGTAVVRAQVSADGQVRAAALATSTLNDDLDVASVAAVRRCFAPAPTDAAATSGELRPVDVLVVWELLPGVGTAAADRPVVRIGVRRPAGS